MGVETRFPKVMLKAMESMNGLFLRRLVAFSTNDETEQEQESGDESLGGWLYELRQADLEVQETFSALFLKSMRETSLPYQDGEDFRIGVERLATHVLEVSHILRANEQDDVVRWLMAYYGDIFDATKWIRFFQNFVDGVTTKDYPSENMGQTIRCLMDGPVTNLFSNGLDDYFRSVLIQREIPNTYTIAQWREAVESFVIRVLQHKVVVQRMVDYSVGRLMELQQDEAFRFDLKISKEGLASIDAMTDRNPGSTSEAELAECLHLIERHPMKDGNPYVGYTAEILPYWMNNLECFGVQLRMGKMGAEGIEVLYEDDLSLEPLASFDVHKVDGLSLWSKVLTQEQALPPFEVRLCVE